MHPSDQNPHDVEVPEIYEGAWVLIEDGVIKRHGDNLDARPPNGATITFKTVAERDAAFPEVVTKKAAISKAQKQFAIDAEHGLTILRSHAAKYTEALLYKSGAVTDPDLLKYLSSEATRCDSTMAACADAIITKAQEVEPVETKRLTDKSNVKDTGYQPVEIAYLSQLVDNKSNVQDTDAPVRPPDVELHKKESTVTPVEVLPDLAPNDSEQIEIKIQTDVLPNKGGKKKKIGKGKD